jgi:hypothetical protein
MEPKHTKGKGNERGMEADMAGIKKIPKKGAWDAAASKRSSKKNIRGLRCLCGEVVDPAYLFYAFDDYYYPCPSCNTIHRLSDLKKRDKAGRRK